MAPKALTPLRRLLAATAAVVVLISLAGCPTVPITPTSPPSPLLGMGTYQWTRGTVEDGPGGPVASCMPQTPPAPAFPAAPVAGEALVGEQDWRNTVADASGAVCRQSRATRWHGLAVFDITAVAANLATGPTRTQSARLTYRLGPWLKNPSSAQDIDLCVRELQLATGYETPAPFVFLPLDPSTGAFPSSRASSLGSTLLPNRAPLGQVTVAGGVTVDPAGPRPTVTVDVTLLFSEWVTSMANEPANSRERTRFGIAFLPFGPSIQQLGLTGNPPTPVPISRSTARCTSIVKDMVLTVTLGR